MFARRVAILAIALPLAGCLEPPVSESLEIRLLRGGASVVSISVTLRDSSEYDKSPGVQQRLESVARDLEAGNDPWSARLRRVDAVREREIVDRERGHLRRVVRKALLSEPEDLREFFRDTGIGVAFAEGKGWAELTLTPGRPARATSAQRQQLATELDAFSANVASYAAAMRALYDYLDANPDRARACLGEILSVKSGGEPTTDAESTLIDGVNDAMSAIGTVLDPAPGEPYTLDEISRYVYDPFPAPVRIVVPGEILEREGFHGDLKSPLQIPGFSIWSAFERLEGRWFSPDPALALWRNGMAKNGQEFDLEGFLAIPRRAEIAPTSVDVRRAIENQLKPEPVYRVRFVPSLTEEAALPFE
jgi:hypothetical protein